MREAKVQAAKPGIGPAHYVLRKVHFCDYVDVMYSPDQSKVKRRAGKFLKSKCEISFSIRYLIFESY